VFRALQTVEDLADDLYVEDPEPERRKLCKAVREFDGYIRANAGSIPVFVPPTARLLGADGPTAGRHPGRGLAGDGELLGDLTLMLRGRAAEAPPGSIRNAS